MNRINFSLPTYWEVPSLFIDQIFSYTKIPREFKAVCDTDDIMNIKIGRVCTQ